MGMTWESIAKEPRDRHNALIKIYADDLVEQCWNKSEYKRKVTEKGILIFWGILRNRATR